MGGKRWTEKELQYLRENYPDTPMDKMVKRLHRDADNIIKKASVLKIKRNHETAHTRNYKIWTDKNIEYLKANYATQSWSQLCLALKKNKNSVTKKANSLGLVRACIWSDEEVEQLRDLYLNTAKSISEISLELDRSESSVKGKLFQENIYRYGEVHPWTTKELQYLKDNYKTKTRFRLAAELNRTPEAISRQGSLLGLKVIRFKKLKKPSRNMLWSEWEINFLKDHYNTMSVNKIAGKLLRSRASVMCKMRRFNLIEGRLKNYHGELFDFYYITEEERKRKYEYMLWWRDVVYVDYRELKKRTRIA